MKLYVVCTHKNRLTEAILMGTLNMPLLSRSSKKTKQTKLSPFPFWPGVMINPQWLKLPIFPANFLGPKDVRAIEVRLFTIFFKREDSSICMHDQNVFRRSKIFKHRRKMLQQILFLQALPVQFILMTSLDLIKFSAGGAQKAILKSSHLNKIFFHYPILIKFELKWIISQDLHFITNFAKVAFI